MVRISIDTDAYRNNLIPEKSCNFAFRPSFSKLMFARLNQIDGVSRIRYMYMLKGIAGIYNIACNAPVYTTQTFTSEMHSSSLSSSGN